MTETPGEPAAGTDKLTVHQLDAILRGLDSLPTFPCVVGRLAELSRPTDSAEQLGKMVHLINSDVAVAARVLSLANAASAAGATTVSQAVDALGAEGTRSAVLSTKVFQPDDAESSFDRHGFWRHCLAVALGAEMLATRMNEHVDPPEAFVCGLLHDLGKLALAHCLPKSYSRALQANDINKGNIAEYERKLLGVDHAIAGRRLAEHWRLPPIVRDVIWLCHQPPEAVPQRSESSAHVALINLADTLARQQRLGFSGNYTLARTCRELAGPLGISEDALAEIAGELPHRTQRRWALLDLAQAAPEALEFYREALAGARVELGRVNERLRQRAAVLADQAAGFRHLRDFAAALTPEATIAETLLRIANVLGAACDCKPTPAGPIVSYSLGAGEDSTLAVCCRGEKPSWRTLSGRPGDGRSDRPPPEAVSDVIDLLVSDQCELTDWVDPAASAHQPLLCAGRWIGGVFLPAGTSLGGEAEEVREALAFAMAPTLAIVQGRCRAMDLSEQLAGASQVLAAAQDALTEAKLLATVGEMAAGAGHELNNPLTVISGRAQLMRDRAENEEDRKTWSLIADQAQRISDVITELMAFASPAAVNLTTLDVAELLHGAAQAFSSSDHPQAAAAHVDIHVCSDTPPVLADPNQMKEALVELIANGATASKPPARIELAAIFDETSDVVVLTVRDRGAGMDGPTIGRAFTPFFSSQRAGRRRGMGLPRVKRAVESNGGRVWIRAQPGEGTTVYVQVPSAPG